MILGARPLRANNVAQKVLDFSASYDIMVLHWKTTKEPEEGRVRAKNITQKVLDFCVKL